jgi:crossover junction endodeoxyribonuclease RuvC
VIFLGLDPGLSGAVAVLSFRDPEPTVSFFDTPTAKVVKNGKNRSEYLIGEMANILRSNTPVTSAVLEKVGAMPGQGVTSMFTFGRGLGIWEGLLAALDIPYTLVAPVTWKKQLMGDMDKSSKDASRIRAVQLFPQASTSLARKKDDGRAEALLMAEYARRKYVSP